jgi:hypothetical protein
MTRQTENAMGNHVDDQVEEYLTGEMNSFALRIFEQHIAKCRFCAHALRDAREAQSCLAWLHPMEAPPEPGPDFYRKIEKSIERKAASGWLSSLAAALQGPRLAYPLLFLFLGLLLTAWTFDFEPDWSDAGVLGIPPARFSDTISSEADQLRHREMVMVSLVEETE